MPLRKTFGIFRHDCWGARLFAPQSRARTDEEAAFEALVEKHLRALAGFLFRMVHDEVVAEKLAEKVFLRLHGSRDRFDKPDRVTAWLYRIATSLAISHGDSVRSERAKGAEPGPVSTQQQEIAARQQVLAIC